MEGGRCQYGYVLSLDGKVWERTPSNSPDAGGFATKQTKQRVSFEDIDYVLYKDQIANEYIYPLMDVIKE